MPESRAKCIKIKLAPNVNKTKTQTPLRTHSHTLANTHTDNKGTQWPMMGLGEVGRGGKLSISRGAPQVMATHQQHFKSNEFAETRL